MRLEKYFSAISDLYKSYPKAHLKYYCAIMKYSNAASLLPARWSRRDSNDDITAWESQETHQGLRLFGRVTDGARKWVTATGWSAAHVGQDTSAQGN